MRFTRWLPVLALAAGLLGAANAGAQQLFWIDTRHAAPTINRCNPDGSGLHTLALPPGSLPEGLTVDDATASVYWTEAAYGGARLRRAGFDLAAVTNVVTGGVALRGVVADGAGTRLLYTTSDLTTQPTLRSVNTNGSSPAVLALLGVAANPRGVAYTAPPSEKILVCDFDRDLIQQYLGLGLMGTWMSFPAGTRPWGVAIADGWVYWTEYGTGTLRRATTAGGSLTTLRTGLANPTYLTLDLAGGWMYWVEAGTGVQRVRRAHLDGTGVEDLPLPLTTYGGIAFSALSTVSAPDARPVTELALAAVSPNPARGAARLDYALPRETAVRLSVLDVQGREVGLLTDASMPAGRHTAVWEPGEAAPGVYFARLRAGDRTLVRRFTLMP